MNFLRSLWLDVRTMPRDLWVLVGGQFINRFGSFVNPFLVLYLRDRGFSFADAAAVVGAIAAGSCVSPAASGYLTDAIGRRNTILVALLGGAVSLLGIYWSATLPQLLVVAAVHGFLAHLFNPAASALLTDLVSPAQRVTAYALLRLAINGGFAAGPAVAGLIYSRANALYLFVGDAVTTLIFAALAWRYLPHGLRTITGRVTSPSVAWQSWAAAGTDAVRNGPFLQYLLGMLLMAVAFVQIFNVLALHATARGLDPAHYGQVMSLNGLIILLCELPLAHWIKRFPPRPMLAVGFTVVGVGCMLFAGATTLPVFFAAMFVFTVGEMLSLPAASAYAAMLAPTAMRGRYYGFQSQAWCLASVAGSAGVAIYGRIGNAWWLISGGFAVLAAVSMLFALRDRRLVVEPA